jgi:ribosomal protein S6
MAKILIPSPVIAEEVKEAAKKEKQKQLEKELKIRKSYLRWLAIRNKQKELDTPA